MLCEGLQHPPHIAITFHGMPTEITHHVRSCLKQTP